MSEKLKTELLLGILGSMCLERLLEWMGWSPSSWWLLPALAWVAIVLWHRRDELGFATE